MRRKKNNDSSDASTSAIGRGGFGDTALYPKKEDGGKGADDCSRIFNN